MGAGGSKLVGAALAAVVAALLICAPGAAAGEQVEAIADGGFEETECPTSGDLGCFNPNWDVTPSYQSYPCYSPPCTGDAASGSGFLGLGGAVMLSFEEEGSASQAVDLPEAGPKTLTFALRAGYEDPLAVGTLAVRVDGNALLTLAEAPSSYETRSVDLRGYSGPTTIAFAVHCTRVAAPIPVGCDSFFVDDVSLPVTADELETAFGRTPPSETSRRRVRFTFSSNRDAATFVCRLDGEDLGACESPLRVRVGRGGHRLAVRAVAGEETDRTPARYRWRVTKAR